MATIPDTVVRQLQYSISVLKDVQFQLSVGREADRKFGGDGRYEWETWEAWKGRAADALTTIDKFRSIAPSNGIDPDLTFAAWGIDPGIFSPGPSARALYWGTDA